jgi:membrane protein
VKLSLVRSFVQKYFDDRAMMLAALLAWGILNTLLPLILGLLALAGLVLQDPAQLAAVQDAILSVLPPQVAPAIRDVMENAAANAGAVGLISLGLLLFNGTNFFVAMEEVFNLIYHVPMRGIVVQRIVALGMLISFAALVVLASFAASMPLLSTLVLIIAFGVLYLVIPNRPLNWKSTLPGAIVAPLAFLLVLRVFPLYIALFGGGFSIYVALGGLLVFLFWLYVVGLIVVTGAELNSFIEHPVRSVQLAAISARGLAGQLELPLFDGVEQRTADPTAGVGN